MSSRKENLTLLVEVAYLDKESVLDALRRMGENDCDFSGENGEGYLWDGAKESGFESNLDYVIESIKDIDDLDELIKEFVKSWMGEDDYYGQVHIDTCKLGDHVVISLAYTSGC